MDEQQLKQLALLRVAFPPHHISKLPKESGNQRDARKTNRAYAIVCTVCGGWHHKDAIHLDYVGHAALTDRLLDADPCWSWEPLALDAGIPKLDANNGLWIKLTVCGVTRLGYGHAGDKVGGDAIKECIGDALRNAAMRFGAALDLWHKGELHPDDEATPPPPKVTAGVHKPTDGAWERVADDRKPYLIQLSNEIKERWKSKGSRDAVAWLRAANITDADERVGLDGCFTRDQQKKLKEAELQYSAELKDAAQQREKEKSNAVTQ